MAFESQDGNVAPCLGVAVLLVALAVMTHGVLAGAAEPKPRREVPDRKPSPMEGSLLDDIVGGDLDLPALMAPYVDPTHHPYRAADLFTDPKVAELAEAARDADMARIDALVAQGVDVNARGNLPQDPAQGRSQSLWYLRGLTPLIYAMSGNSVQGGKSLKGFERLLKRGADPNLQTYGCKSAVTFATERKNPEALRILLSHGGNPNLRLRSPAGFTDDITPTTIYVAIDFNRAENARLLIKAGADINGRAYNQVTPLIWTATRASYEVMYVLLEAGADFRAKDERGFTLVYHLLFDEMIGRQSEEYIKGAASRQKCIEWLAKHGVDWAKEKAAFAESAKRAAER